MRHFRLSLLLVILLTLGFARPCAAIVQFYTEYKKEFLDNHPDKKYVELVNKASNRCFVCHQGKKKKTNHNAFGKHLVELLDRKKDMKDKEKILAAIKKVVAMHVDPKDENSETYLDRIKASKWPGGELEELMKEPPQEEKAAP
jgi:cytochrome c2